MSSKIFLGFLLLVGFLAPASVKAQYGSVCSRNEAKIDRLAHELKLNSYNSTYDTESRERDIYAIRLFQPCAANNEYARKIVESQQDSLRKWDEYCSSSVKKAAWHCVSMAKSSPGKKAESTVQYVAFLMSELNKALSDPNYSADLGSIRGEDPLGSSAKLGSLRAAASPSHEATPADAPDPSCPGQNMNVANEELAKIDNALANYNRQVPENSTAITPALQAVMWGTSKQAEVIKKYCHSESFLARLASLNAAYEAALNACRQINSSPDTDCIPALPDSAAFEFKPAEIPATKPAPSSENTPAEADGAADRATGSNTASGSNASKASPAGKKGTRSSRSASSPSQQPVSAKQEKQHGPLNASSCIEEKNARLVNTCGYDVVVAFCVENPQQTKSFFDNSKAFECPNGGLTTVSVGKAEPNVLHGQLKWFACSTIDIATMKTRYGSGSGYDGRCY